MTRMARMKGFLLWIPSVKPVPSVVQYPPQPRAGVFFRGFKGRSRFTRRGASGPKIGAGSGGVGAPGRSGERGARAGTCTFS